MEGEFIKAGDGNVDPAFQVEKVDETLEKLLKENHQKVLKEEGKVLEGDDFTRAAN